jgi:hypothetical protein
MNRYERLRRVLIVCHHCLTNIAYYRGGYSGKKPTYDRESNFWLTANGNFLDAAVLAWCKLFASKEAHNWKRVVSSIARRSILPVPSAARSSPAKLSNPLLPEGSECHVRDRAPRGLPGR